MVFLLWKLAVPESVRKALHSEGFAQERKFLCLSAARNVFSSFGQAEKSHRCVSSPIMSERTRRRRRGGGGRRRGGGGGGPAIVSNPQTCALLLTCTHERRSTETCSPRRFTSTSTSLPTRSAKTHTIAQHVVQPQPPPLPASRGE